MCVPLSLAHESGKRRSALWLVVSALWVVIIGCLLWITYPQDDASARLEMPRGNQAQSDVIIAGPKEEKKVTSAALAASPANIPEVPPKDVEPLDPLLSRPTLELQTGTLTWEAQIDALLASPLSDSIKARQLLGQLSLMPVEAYSRLAQEAVDRLPDRDYSAVALPVLLNPNTNGSAEAVLYADLLERPDVIALPALLALARDSRHSFAEAARETLTLLLGNDFGTDWKQWESAVAQLLANSR